LGKSGDSTLGGPEGAIASGECSSDVFTEKRTMTAKGREGNKKRKSVREDFLCCVAKIEIGGELHAPMRGGKKLQKIIRRGFSLEKKRPARGSDGGG